MNKIKSFDFRPSVTSKIEGLLEGKITFYAQQVRLEMGDKITVNSAGPAQIISRSSTGDVTQVKTQTELATELTKLLNEITIRAKTPEQKADVAVVKSAADAVSNNDIPTAKAMIRKAGSWVGEVAKDVSAKLIEDWMIGN